MIKKEFRVIDQRDLASLRFIVDDNFKGAVTKGFLVRFLLWFWPLLPDEVRSPLLLIAILIDDRVGPV